MAQTRLEPGDRAPDFTLTNDAGEQVTLSDLRGRKVIVYFYPAAMTPGCTKQACDFTDSLSSLQAAGYEVLGISPDKPEKLAKFRERDGLTITLLSDPDRKVLQEYAALKGSLDADRFYTNTFFTGDRLVSKTACGKGTYSPGKAVQ